MDGDGSGDDKKIMTALRTIIKWSSMSCDDEERSRLWDHYFVIWFFHLTLHNVQPLSAEGGWKYFQNFQKRGPTGNLIFFKGG